MTPQECAGAWKGIVKAYRENTDNRPDTTAAAIVRDVGLAPALEAMAVVARIRHYDGRISNRNRIHRTWKRNTEKPEGKDVEE